MADESSDETSVAYLDQMARALGRIVISFSQLEHSVTMMIASALKLDTTQERALVRQNTIASKLTLLRLLSKQQVKPGDRPEVKAWIDRVASMAERRNDLIHGLYVHKGGKAFILSFAGGHRLIGNPKRETTRDLSLVNAEIQHLRSESEHLAELFDTSRRTGD